jgi:hypothetical protein
MDRQALVDPSIRPAYPLHAVAGCACATATRTVVEALPSSPKSRRHASTRAKSACDGRRFDYTWAYQRQTAALETP